MLKRSSAALTASVTRCAAVCLRMPNPFWQLKAQIDVTPSSFTVPQEQGHNGGINAFEFSQPDRHFDVDGGLKTHGWCAA